MNSTIQEYMRPILRDAKKCDGYEIKYEAIRLMIKTPLKKTNQNPKNSSPSILVLCAVWYFNSARLRLDGTAWKHDLTAAYERRPSPYYNLSTTFMGYLYHKMFWCVFSKCNLPLKIKHWWADHTYPNQSHFQQMPIIPIKRRIIIWRSRERRVSWNESKFE